MDGGGGGGGGGTSRYMIINITNTGYRPNKSNVSVNSKPDHPSGIRTFSPRVGFVVLNQRNFLQF